ncbi:MAG: glutamate 5-kinase, partial [Clostridia bacterium]|nr:glutamate 5-kinase [Clostridia bacterium]
QQANVVVVKIGTSTLTYENGKLNLRRVEQLCRVLSDLQNSGRKIVLVSSGAVGVGMGKMGLETRPRGTAKKQALAAIGQCELMFIYDKFFGEYHQNVAQVLLTADVTANANSRRNVVNTFNELLDMNIIPIVNENDTVAVDELNFGDNDTLSAIVATLVDADALMILTDIDGVYDKNPKADPDAKRIPVIREINDEVRAMAGGAGSNRGTGGMATKIRAAQVAAEKHIPTYILAGDDPENLYRIFGGEDIGTVFEC